MKSCRLPVVVICFLTMWFATGWNIRTAQSVPLNQAHPDAFKIRVGIIPLEPFVFIDENGQLSGTSIDLWNAFNVVWYCPPHRELIGAALL
jgi:ABC-type amino acid transport substrate-binding protein